ncbi:ubiquitin-protein ligase Anaphase Promoting Complex [Pestalotiopsis sp. IQ-011]
MKVNIKKWNAVATWRWDLPEDDVCGICQVHFDGTCPTCKYPGDDCSLQFEWGEKGALQQQQEEGQQTID